MSPSILPSRLPSRRLMEWLPLLLRSLNPPNSKSCQEPETLSAICKICPPGTWTRFTTACQHISIILMVPNIRCTVSGLSIYSLRRQRQRSRSQEWYMPTVHASHSGRIFQLHQRAWPHQLQPAFSWRQNIAKGLGQAGRNKLQRPETPS